MHTGPSCDSVEKSGPRIFAGVFLFIFIGHGFFAATDKFPEVYDSSLCQFQLVQLEDTNIGGYVRIFWRSFYVVNTNYKQCMELVQVVHHLTDVVEMFWEPWTCESCQGIQEDKYHVVVTVTFWAQIWGFCFRIHVVLFWSFVILFCSCPTWINILIAIFDSCQETPMLDLSIPDMAVYRNYTVATPDSQWQV